MPGWQSFHQECRGSCLLVFNNCRHRGKWENQMTRGFCASELGWGGAALFLATVGSMGSGEVLVARAEWGAISHVPLVSETVCCSQKTGLWWVSGDLDSVTVGPGAAHFQSLGFPDSPAHKGAWAR